ncbi:MAG: BREX-1 system phosphatase PglZ type A [Oscillospiraceae bacterium]
MNLQTIQEKLNSEFGGSDRKLVFWYDDHGEFAEEIDTLDLPGAKIHKLTGDNLLYTKYLLEHEDSESSYLVYAPFPKPADIDNHLADTIYYSKQFFADRVSLLCADLQIPEKFQEHLGQFPKFWKSNERVQQFAALGIEHYNAETIDIGLLAVMVGVKTPSFEEVLKTLIVGDNYLGSKYLSAMDKVDLLPVFWQMCERYYGYGEEAPTLEKLIATLLMTYTEHGCTGSLPKPYQPFVSTKQNDIAVFVSNLMNNMLCKDRYDEIAAALALKFKLTQYITAEDIARYYDCDGFEIFDTLIIQTISKLLAENGEPLEAGLHEMIKKRGSKCHYAQKFCGYYRAISRADKLIAAVKAFSQDSANTADEMIARYVKQWHHIDRYYRQFYAAFDRLADCSPLLDLRKVVENIYTNAYLAKLSLRWAERLENVSEYSALAGTKQYSFYRSVAAPAAKKECTVVILSDAFRFECGSELYHRFTAKAGTTAELSYLLSTLPSYTGLGMAALLPHKSLSYSDRFEEVLVDGMKCRSTEDRAGILIAAHPAATVLTYTEVMAMKRDAVRDALAGKDLVYIYHDQIDARGDHPATENEVFTAAEEAMGEIMSLVQKLAVDRSIGNFLITADHGFLYKRDKLEESDKVNLKKLEEELLNKRYILTRGEAPDIEGTLTYSMGYLDKSLSDCNVTVPRGVDIFKSKGGGQNYVHGGLSLQEVVVPLLRVKTERGKKDVSTVKVALTSLTRKITNLITYLDFIQTENISDTLTSAKLGVYFEAENGERISGEQIIVADKKNAPAEKRQFHEKFTFKNRKYLKSEKYYLVMMDLDSGVEAARHEFIFDIAFANDFGFGL